MEEIYMKDKKGIFYIFASLAYMAIAVYSINTDSLFLGFAWGIVSIANLVEGVYLVRKRKQQMGNICVTKLCYEFKTYHFTCVKYHI